LICYTEEGEKSKEAHTPGREHGGKREKYGKSKGKKKGNAMGEVISTKLGQATSKRVRRLEEEKTFKREDGSSNIIHRFIQPGTQCLAKGGLRTGGRMPRGETE